MNTIILLSLMFFLISCESTQKKNDKDNLQKTTAIKPCYNASTFQAHDSAGIAIGTIKQVEDTSSMGGTVIVVLLDKNNKERQFHGYYSKTKGLDINNLRGGRCIEIDYYAEIEREDGVEVSRLFNIIAIRFLDL